ncbi:sensor histidine kinase [Cesiribacter sp. SM1]|uniref:sensor histidine kinase n=1 Tax=Cesiribacter sp. SM1 TaxID=2861196 RepID=UPI001CD47123|nr:histidine kinase [Cesiribacter sp. SM1]
MLKMKISTWLGNEAYIFMAYWCIILAVFWLQVFPQTNSVAETTLFSVLLLLSIYHPATYLSKAVLLRAMRDKKVGVFVLRFLLFSVLVGSILLGYLFFFYYLESLAVFPASEYFSLARSPSYAAILSFSSSIFINLCICGLRFMLEYLKSQKAVLQYQLQTLQHQITPHFMFNVLNHIHVLMQEDVERASALLIKYSDILRYQLYNGEKKLVSLAEEVQFLKNFIDVEEFRWEDKLTVRPFWNIENEEIKIPALLFITFIENAFKYTPKSTSNPGYIDISFEQAGNHLRLEVENSKPAFAAKNLSSTGVGLKNTRERLNILYPGNHDLQITDTGIAYQIQLEINL